MRTDTFYIIPRPNAEHAEVFISFKKFIAYLQEKAKTGTQFQTQYYATILQKFCAYPGINKPVAADDIHKCEGLPDILDACLFPQLCNEHDTLWSLRAADTDYVFLCSEAFYNLISPFNENHILAQATDEELEEIERKMCEVKYSLILERIYNIKPYLKKNTVYEYIDKTSGLTAFYSIQPDNRFVDVVQKKLLPNVNAEIIKEHISKTKSLCSLQELLPLSAFAFEGFVISTAYNVTPNQALHKMRSVIIKHKPEKPRETFEHTINLLKALGGEQQIDFGLLPILKLGGQIILFYENYSHSILINIAKEQQLDKNMVLSWLNEFFLNPRIIFNRSNTQENEKNKTKTEVLNKAGICDYALLPICEDDDLVGLLEVSAAQKNVLDSTILSHMEPAMPILAQLMHKHREEFTTAIDRVVSMNFTSIQPSVQWRFDDAAWHYIEAYYEDSSPGKMEPIRFQNVYPLYGAIDIRDSTVKKNRALYKDMQTYFPLLQQTISELNINDAETRELLQEATTIQDQTEFELANNEGVVINLMKRVNNYLHQAVIAQPGKVFIANKYFKAVDFNTGCINNHRQALEKSMQIINGSINKYLDKMQAACQKIYPVYFDKFRTDGVEYDIYVGQSIAPHQQYDEKFVQSLRFEQLKSMAGITKLLQSHERKMPVPLKTTQLIYVNANAIDISFRLDEKRFDVEGAYNTRYHIVKKRIDKVHIKDTGERLTQPGKIAIVYSQKEHANEYKQYIAQLQQEGILQPNEEELELEELQGVTGMFALRTSVAM